nr:MAG TPA: hypothetical protein [Caudoviricetes sp.]
MQCKYKPRRANKQKGYFVFCGPPLSLIWYSV